MKHLNASRATLFSICVAAAMAGAPALAQTSVSISTAPPPPIVETVPTVSPGYVWTPGYWAWHGDRHIWVHGRPILQRSGYRWEPERWDQRSGGYYQTPGRWQSEGNRNKNRNGRQQDR